MRNRSSDLIHRSGWMPMWTIALVHIGDVTVYVTWYVLWRTQWTLTTGMMVVTIGVKPAHLQFHSGSCAGCKGFIIYWIRSFSDKGQRIRQGQTLLMLQPQRQRTVLLIISVFIITSLLEWTVAKLKYLQIYCSRYCNELCYTFNARFLTIS